MTLKIVVVFFLLFLPFFNDLVCRKAILKKIKFKKFIIKEIIKKKKI